MSVKEHASAYLSLLKSARGYRHAEQYKGTGKYFWQRERSILIYDKLKEAEGRGQVPADLIAKNLLRYELRFFYPARLLGYPGGVPITEILKPDFINRLLCLWVREYFAIVKNRALTGFPVYRTQKQFMDTVLLSGIKYHGGESGLYEIADSHCDPDCDNAIALRSKIKRRIAGLHKSLKVSDYDPRVIELDDLILQTAMTYRQ